MECATKQRRTVKNAFVYSGVIVNLNIQEDSQTNAVLTLENTGKHPVYDAVPIKDPLDLPIYVRNGSEKEAQKKDELEGLKKFMDMCRYPLYDIKILISSAEKGRKVAISQAKRLLEDHDTAYSFTRATYPKDPWEWRLAEMRLYAYKSTAPKNGFWIDIGIVPTDPTSIRLTELDSEFISQKKQLVRP